MKASSTDPSTWASHERAHAYMLKAGLDGLMYALTREDEIVFVDLDHCRDVVTGEIEPEARKWVAAFDSYSEVSPSGDGIHVLLRGSLPDGRGRHHGGFEIYSEARFLTITGQHIEGTPWGIERRPEAVAAYLAENFPPETLNGHVHDEPTSRPMTDDRVIELAGGAKNSVKFEALWGGDTSEYPSQSEADSALCCILGFYTQDPDQIDRLFRRSVLYRPKWDEKHGRGTYGQLTIENALRLTKGNRWSGPGPRIMFPHRDRIADRATERWPDPLEPEAFHGLLGDTVRAISPFSEADQAALMAHALTAFGAVIGANVKAFAGDAEHPPRLNSVIVGDTSKGRKGSAQRPTERIILAADPKLKIVEGASSGEGLIWQVHDKIMKTERFGKGADAYYEDVVSDPGVLDKRLWVVESEFAGTLRVAQREGNTLTAVVRRAWDRGDLHTLTKNSPAMATGAHIGITGHITRDELRRYLDRTELASGFANRFLWFVSRRGNVLPDGERVPDEVVAPLADRLLAAIQWAKASRVLRRDPEASALWRDIYEELSEGLPGMLGGATNRAEAQVLRISVLEAALDRSEQIRAEHLQAALAIWKYCADSAAWIFGDAIGDPTADTILAALRQGPLTRTDINNLLGRHVAQARVEQALLALLTTGRVERRTEQTGGRPVETWVAK